MKVDQSKRVAEGSVLTHEDNELFPLEVIAYGHSRDDSHPGPFVVVGCGNEFSAVTPENARAFAGLLVEAAEHAEKWRV